MAYYNFFIKEMFSDTLCAQNAYGSKENNNPCYLCSYLRMVWLAENYVFWWQDLRPQASYGWDQRKVQLANHKEANDFMHASAPQSWVPWF